MAPKPSKFITISSALAWPATNIQKTGITTATITGIRRTGRSSLSPVALMILHVLFIVESSLSESLYGRMPVTQPPCRPGRAVFPHPVLRLYSLPRCKAEPSCQHSPTFYLSDTGPRSLDAVEDPGKLLPGGLGSWRRPPQRPRGEVQIPQYRRTALFSPSHIKFVSYLYILYAL
jgi:hypothetical protein